MASLALRDLRFFFPPRLEIHYLLPYILYYYTLSRVLCLLLHGYITLLHTLLHTLLGIPYSKARYCLLHNLLHNLPHIRILIVI